jgi:hypothetical protein
MTAVPVVTVAAPVAEALSRAAVPRHAGSGATSPAATDRPPPVDTGAARRNRRPPVHRVLAFLFRDMAEKERQLPGGAAGTSG